VQLFIGLVDIVMVKFLWSLSQVSCMQTTASDHLSVILPLILLPAWPTVS